MTLLSGHVQAALNTNVLICKDCNTHDAESIVTLHQLETGPWRNTSNNSAVIRNILILRISTDAQPTGFQYYGCHECGRFLRCAVLLGCYVYAQPLCLPPSRMVLMTRTVCYKRKKIPTDTITDFSRMTRERGICKNPLVPCPSDGKPPCQTTISSNMSKAYMDIVSCNATES